MTFVMIHCEADGFLM